MTQAIMKTLRTSHTASGTMTVAWLSLSFLALTGNQSPTISHHDMSPSAGETEDERLQKALQQVQERALDRFLEHDAPEWMTEVDSFPFECTECGKCCKTIGSVYLSPDEIQSAATLLGLSAQDFVDTYASHTLSDGSQTWAKLQDKEDACIFLKDDRYCAIYEARPVQCRTYPFWPAIVKSPETWNAECRRADDDVESPLPEWTPSEGGCEGMQPLLVKGDEKKRKLDAGVPMRDGASQLFDSVSNLQRFPKHSEEEAVQ